MDSLTSVSPSMYTYGLPAAAGSSSQATPGAGTSVEQSTLNLQAQLTSTLLGSLGAPTVASTPSLLSSPDPSSLFASGTELSLLNAQGTVAMAYLTPQAPPPGQTVNGLA
jgi:hypothetical protein